GMHGRGGVAYDPLTIILGGNMNAGELLVRCLERVYAKSAAHSGSVPSEHSCGSKRKVRCGCRSRRSVMVILIRAERRMGRWEAGTGTKIHWAQCGGHSR